VNLTTHTGKTDGVCDLNGNVWEWTGTLGNEGGLYIVNDVPIGIAIPAGGYVTTLSTSPLLRRYGMPEATGSSGIASFGGDYFYSNASTNIKSIRGGHWGKTGNAGVWCTDIYSVRSNTYTGVGFRPVLAF
jgi:formylglycine-generating enzyme required for sulfatase activity